MKITTIPVGTLGTNCYLLQSEAGNCTVIDPGAQGEKLAEVIRIAGLTPRYILLTHGHYDHVGAVNHLTGLYPGAPVGIGTEDEEMLADPAKRSGSFRSNQEEIAGAVLLGDGDTLELDDLTIKVVSTPGHTKGGVCYVVEDVIFSGDTLFRDDIGRCDLFGGDYATMKRSLKKLTGLSGNYTVYPGHGPATTLDHERHNNYYINEK